MQNVESTELIRAELPLARSAASNCYPSADSFESAVADARVRMEKQPAATMLLVDWHDVIQVYAQLWDAQADFVLPQTDKPLLMEVVSRTNGMREAPFLDYWLAQGFRLAQTRNEYTLKLNGTTAPCAHSLREPTADETGAALALFRAQLDVATVRLPDRLETGNMLCSFDEAGQMTGALHASRAGRAGILEHLAVAPHARRSGIGKALLETWLSLPAGAERRLWVLEQNKPAIALYTSVGFQPNGRTCYSLLKD